MDGEGDIHVAEISTSVGECSCSQRIKDSSSGCVL